MPKCFSKKFFVVNAIMLGIFVLLPNFASAANRYWVGPAGGTIQGMVNWSSVAGGACGTGGASVPGPSDVVIFQSSCNNGPTTDANLSVAGITMNAGFTGTVTQGGSFTITVGSSNYIQNGGNFVGGTGSIIINGTATIASGTMTTTSGTTTVTNMVINGTGKVVMATNGILQIMGNGTPLSGSGTLDVTTNTPNTVEYKGNGVTNITAATPVTAYHHLKLDPGTATGFNLTSQTDSTENDLTSAVVDPKNGFAYFGTGTSPGVVVKYRMSDSKTLAILTLNSGENNLYAATIDTDNGFAYFGTRTSPGIVVKVNLANFTRVNAITLNTGENQLRSAVIDTAGGYAYFGTESSAPGIVVKIQLSDFTRNAALVLNAGENNLRSAAIDTTGGYAYFGTDTSPGIVVKVQLSSFTRQAGLTLNSGENFLTSAGIDTINGNAYFGTDTSPGIVVKVQLSSFTRQAGLTLNSGENNLESGSLDAYNGYAYFGTNTSPGIVIRVKLSNFSRDSAITLNISFLTSSAIDTSGGSVLFGTFTNTGYVVQISLTNFTRISGLILNGGENQVETAVIDTKNGFAYFGTYTSPGIIVKVRLSDNTRVGALTLNSGENKLRASVIDVVNGFAYFATATAPGIVIKINLSSFSRVGSITLNAGEDNVFSGVIDTINGNAYFGTAPANAPGIVVKIQLSDFTRNAALTLNSGETTLLSAAIDPVNGFAYFGTSTSPGVVVKVRLSDFTRVGAITFNAGENQLGSAVIDTINGFAYFGTLTSPGIVVKVRLSDFTRRAGLTLNTGENKLSNAVFDTINDFAYFGTNTWPGSVVKIRLTDFTHNGVLFLVPGLGGTGEAYLTCAVVDETKGVAYFGSTGNTPSVIVKIGLGDNATMIIGTAAGQTLKVNGNLTIGNGIDSVSLTADTYNPKITILGSVLIRANGALVASSTNTFTAAGNWSNLGNFVAQSGTVTLNGSSQLVSGNTTFNNFTINAPDTVTFANAGLQSFIGNFNATGTAANIITINSDVAGTPGTLYKASGVVSCDYLSLQDSAATGGASWFAGLNSVDVSGNSGWIWFGSLIIKKNTTGGDATFTYNILPTPTIITVVTTNGTGQTTNSGMVSGKYDVTESVPSGWAYNSGSCVLQNGTATGSAATNGVSQLTIQSNRTTTCTFSNTAAGPTPYVTNMSLSNSYCAVSDNTAQNMFSWQYNNDSNINENQFELQIADNSAFTTSAIDRTFSNLNNPTGTVNQQVVSVTNTGINSLKFNQAYYWRVKVWQDNGSGSPGNDSGWVQGTPFTTAAHAGPNVSFTFSPQNPSQGQSIQFTDGSTCYNASGSATCQSFAWDFGDTNTSTVENPSHAYIAQQIYNVVLKVSDELGSCSASKIVVVNSPSNSAFPIWKEIAP